VKTCSTGDRRRTCRSIVRFSVATITASIAAGYVLGGFTYPGNLWWVALCTLLYVWLARPIVDLYVSVGLCLLSRFRGLPSIDEPDEPLSADHRMALVYCVRATSEEAVHQACDSMRRSLDGNHSEYLHAIYLSDTEKIPLILSEITRIRKIQESYGCNRVLYVHRSSGWGRKWGAYQDLMIWLHTGSEAVSTYTAPRYGDYRRDAALPLFSLQQLADVVSPSVVRREEVSSGIIGDAERLHPAPGNHVRYMVVSDADVEWENGSLRVLAGIMRHPQNRSYSVFQPHIAVRNHSSSIYAWMLAVGRRFSEFAHLAVWRANECFYFFGKGGIRIADYIDTMLRSEQEILFPRALSHDFLEAAHLRTAYVPRVHAMEDVPTSYTEDLQRMRRWVAGDLLVIVNKQLVPRLKRMLRIVHGRQHTVESSRVRPELRFVLLAPVRFVLSPSLFGLFVLLRLLGGSITGLYVPGNVQAEVASLCFVLFGVVLLPRVAGPIAAGIHTRRFNFREIRSVIGASIPELFLSTLIFLQQLIDRTAAVIGAASSILRVSKTRGQLPWRTSQEAAVSARDQSYAQIYRERLIVLVIGLGMAVGTYVSQSAETFWFTMPIWLSFVLGPGLSKITGRSVAFRGSAQ